MAKKQKSADHGKGKARKMRKQRNSPLGKILIPAFENFTEALTSGENIAKRYKCYRVTSDGKRKLLRKFP